MDYRLLTSLKVQNTLGEGVLWNSRDGSVWWVDILDSKLFRFHLRSEQLESWELPERMTAFGFIEDDDRMVAAFASGIAFYDYRNNEREWIVRNEQVPGNRNNDGRVDPMGRFWVGTMVEDDQQSSSPGGLYCLNGDLSCQKVLDDLQISNGLCWSPDTKYMYHADSPRQQICRYDFDAESGEVSNKTIFADTPENCYPDGAVTDKNGCLWSAMWGGSRVIRYSPDGQISDELQLPVPNPTCVCFGGDNLDLLIVTTATEGLSSEQLEQFPESGNLFIYQTTEAGLDAPLFRLSN